MRRRIRGEFILVAFVSIFLTTLLIIAVFYRCFQKEIMDELGICTRMLQNMEEPAVLEKADRSYDGLELQGIRLSLIRRDGEVLYDNGADVGGMDNHGNRPEVEEALRRGYGQAVRRSDTLDRSAFYYAVLLSDGNILRTARESSSIWGIFVHSMPAVFAVSAFVFLFCFFLSARAARTLIEPVERLAENLDECDDAQVYQEMQPFIRRIRRQHEDLLKNVRLRQNFTANISHELKTPLTSISGYAELIERGMADQTDTRRFAGEIHKNAARLLRMINDIIRLSELDVMEKESVVFEEVPLYQTAKISVDMLQMHAKKHQVTLSMEGAPCSIRGNKEMIEEVLYNLCDNGIHYNREGGSVRVTAEPAGERVRLCVEDTGIGIAKKYQERVFERFYRVDKSRSRLTGGTGLGLAIVKHIAEQHQAELTLESREGEGTRIVLLFDRVQGK